MHFLQRTSARIAILSVWAVAIGWGVRILLLYSNTAGAAAQAPGEWPSGVPIEAAQARCSLVVFIHPQCPCSRSSLGELARIIATGRNRVQTTVFFYLPSSSAEDWAHTDLWETAAAIPNVRVLADPDAAAAKRFGARTSGQALLYDANHRLVFSGGITAARGHSGDNDGRDAIVDQLFGRTPRRRTTPVFGCALYGE